MKKLFGCAQTTVLAAGLTVSALAQTARSADETQRPVTGDPTMYRTTTDVADENEFDFGWLGLLGLAGLAGLRHRHHKHHHHDVVDHHTVRDDMINRSDRL